MGRSVSARRALGTCSGQAARGRGFRAGAGAVLRVEEHEVLAVLRLMGGCGGCFASEVEFSKGYHALQVL